MASISASYFRRTFSVSLTISWPSSGACSSTSTRAQSMVSLTDGSFFRSSVRTSWMKPTICLRSVCEMPGTRLSTIRSSSFCSGKPICRCRQRRFSASPRSRSLFEVRITVGAATADNGAEFRNGDLEIAENFQQQRFELGVRLVDFVDQQHAAGGLLQRLQQRPRLDEFLGEEHVAEIVQAAPAPSSQRRRAAEHFAELVLQDLRVQKLLGVFPLVERLGLVQPLIALQADHLQPAPGGDRFRKLGLADAGGAFDQDGLFDLLRQIDRGRDLAARNIALRRKTAFHCLDRGRRPDFQPRVSTPNSIDFGVFCLRSRQRTSAVCS